MRMLAGGGYFLLECMLPGAFPVTPSNSTFDMLFNPLMLASRLRFPMHADFLKIQHACCQGGIFFFVTPPHLHAKCQTLI